MLSTFTLPNRHHGMAEFMQKHRSEQKQGGCQGQNQLIDPNRGDTCAT